MAPEQLAARGVTRTADVYAMGVVLWELLTGTRLFPGDSQAAIVAAVLAGATGAPSGHAPNLPDGLDALVMRALAQDPADRFATALDMAERLMRIVPPAFPTDVGTWCERTARESLAKRGMLLADIESSSGTGRRRVEYRVKEARGWAGQSRSWRWPSRKASSSSAWRLQTGSWARPGGASAARPSGYAARARPFAVATSMDASSSDVSPDSTRFSNLHR